ncbi:MAG TPA: helix-turn-helix transcriptional regulator [Paludibaculum sp.]
MAELESGRCRPWKAHRLRGRVTLEEIADVTKISKRFLEAIERGAYGELPGGVFMTSYIRQYAAMIDFDSGEILGDEAGVGTGKAAVVSGKGGGGWGRAVLGGALEKG